MNHFVRVCQQVINVYIVVAVFCTPAWNSVRVPSVSALVVSNILPSTADTSKETSAAAFTGGFHVSGRSLLDANGNEFIMRGVNHPHTWFPTETSSFTNIKNKRANTVRVVLSNGNRWTKNGVSEVASVIQLCKNNRLTCVLEVHDTTGYGEQAGASSLSEAVNYWNELKSILAGQEAYVIINLGNEPYGNNNTVNWVSDTKNAIVAMRAAGFQHMLMVDAPNWGQDGQFLMRDNAADILANDPLNNTVFSIHMFGVFNTAAKVEEYILSFVNANLPLVIGEFGHLHSDGDPVEDDIIRLAEKYGISYLGWSWSGNSGGVEYLDMVLNFDPNQTTPWGKKIFEGVNGILLTACEASVYGKHCFDDVPINYWAWNFVERLYRTGITGGCNTNPRQYCPEATVTRAQMAVFLLRGRYGSSYTPPPVSDDTGFLDVPTTHWAAAWIKQLAAEGITSGCGGSNYCPEGPVTRAQMAVFLLKAKHGAAYAAPALGDSTGFTDVSPTYWAAAWIKQLVAEGITAGCGTGTYCPESPVTRAQMAVFLVRTFNLP